MTSRKCYIVAHYLYDYYCCLYQRLDGYLFKLLPVSSLGAVINGGVENGIVNGLQNFT